MNSFLKLFTCLTLLLSISCTSSDDSDGPINNTNAPSVQINGASNITSSSADISGNVSQDGGEQVTSRGFCWSTDPNPDLSDDSVSLSTGTGIFETTISGLMPNTNYFVRAYATNLNGTAYSSEITFSTLDGCGTTFFGLVELSTQQEVNDFGLMNYCEVTECFVIRQNPNGTDPITDLTPLIGLEKVGCLIVTKNTMLQSLMGLNGITDVAKAISIDENPMLTEIDPLSNIISPINSILISENDLLENIDGLLGITSMITVDANQPLVVVTKNPHLTNINGLLNIGQIENGVVRFTENNSLTNIDGLSNMPNTLSNIILIDNTNLTNLTGISHFTNFNGSFTFFGDSITDSSLTAFNGLNSVAGKLTLNSSSVLTSLNGLSNLTSVGGLEIGAMSILDNLDGLDNLITVSTDLEIFNNAALMNYCALTNLIQGNGLGGQYLVTNNLYNPTFQDILDGNCSL